MLRKGNEHTSFIQLEIDNYNHPFMAGQWADYALLVALPAVQGFGRNFFREVSESFPM